MPADLVLRGGTILTFADWSPGSDPGHTTAIAIGGGEITATGDAALREIGRRTRVVELAGRTVLPGVNDTHLHLVCYAMARYGLLDVSARVIGDWSGLADVLTAEAIGADGWIRAQGWDASALGRPGTARDVDAALRAHGLEHVPTALFDRTGHQLLVGTAALERIGVDAETPDPPGGVVAREDGVPTGVFTDSATALVLTAMPPVSRDALRDVLRRAQQDLLALGITSATDPGIGPGHTTLFDGSPSPLALEALASLADDDELHVRTTVLLTFSGTGGESVDTVREGLDGPLPSLVPDRIDPRTLRVAGVKVFADGIQRSGTAFHRDPYGPHGTRGSLAVAGADDDERSDTLRGILREIGARGWQAGIHATGDAASDEVVEALRALPEGDRGALPYIIHGDFLTAEGMPALARDGIGWTANPVISRMVCGIGLDLLGPERQSVRQPLGSALRAGVTVTLSSDAPVVSPDWREAAITAVQRAQIDGAPRPGDDEAVSLTDAIAMMTVLAARLDGAADFKGRLAPGFAADLIVLSDRLPDSDRVDRLRDLAVDMTVVDGVVRWERAR
ncbi:amidohydrolase [Microbacterium hominis]|uniref:Amidohydrolase family protein n=1 Tax=Microbacterium hominis TaxID=162426 RepID=A0A7D4PNQ2_9MICO|nr:amidohydrolase family protein [Microbacterium hominis]QKJ20470.1 amidohydrolase family protein [Microbacterium hominis]